MAVRTDGGLASATIRILDGEEEGTELTAMFNPSEYSLSKSLQFQEQDLAGRTSPVTQFVSGEARTLSMELFFDDTHGGARSPSQQSDGFDLVEELGTLDTLLQVDPNLGAPPRCAFAWGNLEFRAVLDSAEKQFTMFDRQGNPTRARVNVTFTEYRPPGAEQAESGSSSANQPRQRTVEAGDTLSAIAGEEYGDPSAWRQIAEANGVDDPRSLQPGASLTIPPNSQ